MAAKTRRAYKGGAAPTTITAPLNAGATTFQISSYTGWPYGSDPFHVVVEPGTANEEKILVTRSGSTDTTLNVVSGGRGADDTSDLTHNTGSDVYPVFTAVDADEANELTSTLTSKGDLLTMDSGPSFSRLAVGTNGLPLVADSAETTGLKWGQIGESAIADGAITASKLSSGNFIQVYPVQINSSSGNVSAGSDSTFVRYVDFTPISSSSTILIFCNFFAAMEGSRNPAVNAWRGTLASVPSGVAQPADFTRISYSTSISGNNTFNPTAQSGVHTSDYDVTNISFTVTDEPGVTETLRYGFTLFNTDSVTRKMQFNYGVNWGSRLLDPYPTWPVPTIGRSMATFVEVSG